MMKRSNCSGDSKCSAKSKTSMKCELKSTWNQIESQVQCNADGVGMDTKGDGQQ